MKHQPIIFIVVAFLWCFTLQCHSQSTSPAETPEPIGFQPVTDNDWPWEGVEIIEEQYDTAGVSVSHTWSNRYSTAVCVDSTKMKLTLYCVKDSCLNEIFKSVSSKKPGLLPPVYLCTMGYSKDHVKLVSFMSMPTLGFLFDWHERRGVIGGNDCKPFGCIVYNNCVFVLASNGWSTEDLFDFYAPTPPLMEIHRSQTSLPLYFLTEEFLRVYAFYEQEFYQIIPLQK